MSTEAKPRVRHYVTQARLREYLQTAREFGIEVGSFEVTPDGTIRVTAVAAMQRTEPEKPSAYDMWKAGKLARQQAAARAK
ncbi:hypothetical protein [Novosphingobium sp. 11B]